MNVNLYDAELPREPEEERRAGYCEDYLRFGPMIGAAKIGMTIYELKEGERICPYHYELGNEEWLIVLDGEPTLRTPDGEQKLVRGDVAVFPDGPDGAHDVTGPGRVAMMSTRIDPSGSVYPDSNKIGIWPPGKLFRLDDAVDYFEGEQ
jgi:Uncharacterized conserved protein, contains double-stranded beta-helix domain